MKNKHLLIGTLASVTLGLAACGGSQPAKTTASNTPANTAANSAAKPASTTAANSKPATTSAQPKTELKNEKKPEGEAKTAKKVAVPENWIYTYDESKGYGFYLPEGSKGDYTNVNGVDIFSAMTPAPSEIGVMVLAYKDAKKTKEDLLNDAEAVLEALGEKVETGKLEGESDDYYVADATTTSTDGKKGRAKIVVGTDVTDNYVMIVAADASKYDANKDIIDKIWGSFEMWSGGASGNN
jgi:hypothetical protein